MTFGRLGTLGSGFGRLGSGGGSAIDPLTPPDPPTITLTSGATDLTPEFTFVASINLEEDDVIRFYDQTIGLLAPAHTVTAGEAGGDPIYLDIAELTPGDYDFYATHARSGAESDPSNVESITLTSGSSSGWNVNFWWR